MHPLKVFVILTCQFSSKPLFNQWFSFSPANLCQGPPHLLIPRNLIDIPPSKLDIHFCWQLSLVGCSPIMSLYHLGNCVVLKYLDGIYCTESQNFRAGTALGSPLANSSLYIEKKGRQRSHFIFSNCKARIPKKNCLRVPHKIPNQERLPAPVSGDAAEWGGRLVDP